MAIKSMKQALHWIFLAVGVFSLIMMGMTVNTYLDYAREGYGLKMSFDSAALNNDWLVLKFYFENPGGLDIDIMGGNLTMSQEYEIPNTLLPNHVSQDYPEPLHAHENTSVMIWIPITDPDLGDIQMHHQADIDVNLLLHVPERYVNTHISFRATVEVES